ncbi:MAG: peptidylprolyl isomerase [Lachnospiraceae bacterium]|nr:peptidylprolyl isomerase [Lachnospiraceae bacterium]
MKKKLLSFLLLSMLAFCFTACSKDKAKEDTADRGSASGEAGNTVPADLSIPEEGLLDRDYDNLLSGKYNIEIEVENFGTIALTLDADIAPVTVTNFIDLINDGFYNGLTFHRIINGFMIQGGDPDGNGTGGSGRNIQGEFAANGIENNLAHTRGVISMARATPKDSASSQFFIMHEDAPHLDGGYAAFGEVTSGMEVVDAICETTKVEDNNGTVLAENQPKIKEIRIVE